MGVHFGKIKRVPSSQKTQFSRDHEKGRWRILSLARSLEVGQPEKVITDHD